MSSSKSPSAERATWWEAALMIRGQTEVDQRNLRAIWIWAFAWIVVVLAATAALRRLPELSGPLLWTLALLPILFGIPLVKTILRFIRDADEFMRKVQLEGIAMGYGAGFVFCVGYQVLTVAGAPDLSVVFAAFPLAFGWALGSFLVAYRHR